MENFFRTIKKKRHKRRLSALWLVLVVMEMFCPVLCDEPNFVAQLDSPVSIVQNNSENEKSAAASDYQAAPDEKTCNDECLCHATPLMGIAFASPEKVFTRSEQIVFLTETFYTSSLSPPHRPPKIS